MIDTKPFNIYNSTIASKWMPLQKWILSQWKLYKDVNRSIEIKGYWKLKQNNEKKNM